MCDHAHGLKASFSSASSHQPSAGPSAYLQPDPSIDNASPFERQTNHQQPSSYSGPKPARPRLRQQTSLSPPSVPTTSPKNRQIDNSSERTSSTFGFVSKAPHAIVFSLTPFEPLRKIVHVYIHSLVSAYRVVPLITRLISSIDRASPHDVISSQASLLPRSSFQSFLFLANSTLFPRILRPQTQHPPALAYGLLAPRRRD